MSRIYPSPAVVSSGDGDRDCARGPVCAVNRCAGKSSCSTAARRGSGFANCQLPMPTGSSHALGSRWLLTPKRGMRDRGGGVDGPTGGRGFGGSRWQMGGGGASGMCRCRYLIGQENGGVIFLDDIWSTCACVWQRGIGIDPPRLEFANLVECSEAIGDADTFHPSPTELDR